MTFVLTNGMHVVATVADGHYAGLVAGKGASCGGQGDDHQGHYDADVSRVMPVRQTSVTCDNRLGVWTHLSPQEQPTALASPWRTASMSETPSSGPLARTIRNGCRRTSRNPLRPSGSLGRSGHLSDPATGRGGPLALPVMRYFPPVDL